MNLPLKAAIVGIVINVVLSYTVSYLPKLDVPVYSDTISMMEHHRETIVTSSIIVGVAVSKVMNGSFSVVRSVYS